ARALLRGAPGTGLRHPRGCEGDRGAGAGAQAHAPARAVGAAGERRRCRARLARDGPGAADAGGPVPLTTSASPRLAGYAALGAVGLLAALAFGRPALAAMSVPFAVALGLGFAASSRPELNLGFSLDVARTLEGSTVGAHLDVRADGPAEWIELELLLPDGVTAVADSGRTAFRLGAGESRRLDYELHCERWGAYRLGLVDVRIRSAF